MREWRGVGMALLVMSVWAGSLGVLLTQRITEPAWWIPFAVVWMTWLYTGLFITAHDAMHGSLAPGNARLNHALGTVAVGAYAMFDYRLLRQAHGRHHASPAAPGDPDWHDGTHDHPVRWFLAFMMRYLTWGQAGRLVVVFWTLAMLVDMPALLLFWALPSMLSTIQLFWFGTYLPHREPAGGHTHEHRATSARVPDWVSLATCFHFGGYHQEHHEQPGVPWWALPRVRRSSP